jgi:hypothetical protein
VSFPLYAATSISSSIETNTGRNTTIQVLVPVVTKRNFLLSTNQKILSNLRKEGVAIRTLMTQHGLQLIISIIGINAVKILYMCSRHGILAKVIFLVDEANPSHLLLSKIDDEVFLVLNQILEFQPPKIDVIRRKV